MKLVLSTRLVSLPATSRAVLPRRLPPAYPPRVPSSLSWPSPSRQTCHSNRLVAFSSAPPLFANRASAAPRHRVRDTYIQLQSSLAGNLPLVALALAAVGFYWLFPSSSPGVSSNPRDDPHDIMAGQLLPGRPGNLTPEQEEKLRELWSSVLSLCGVTEKTVPEAEDLAAKGKTPTAEAETQKKKRFGMFRKKDPESKQEKAEKKEKHSAPTEDDKYGQNKAFHEILANQSPEAIHDTIWSMVKHDHPDALLLRFLRARKWDVERALVMMVSTMNWRQNEMHVDDDIMLKGEEAAVKQEQAEDAETKKTGQDFLAQIRMGKSFLHGVDKEGRPICVVRVRLHKQGEQAEESLERYTVYIIETARMVLKPPIDTATIIFDMTGFSMANMDYTPVKFMIKCFEANYPESLGAVLVHNAPWVFQGIWKIIRGWLDPVVAGKVHFTNNKSELENFIEPGRILKELGGDEDWEYKYAEVVPGENDKMKDTATRDKMLEARKGLVSEFESLTAQWCQSPDEATKAKRDEVATKLREDYWNLDPYLRARSVYDRQGALQAGGKVDWYGEPKTEAHSAVQTSADDLD